MNDTIETKPSTISILGREGDIKISWTIGNATEEEAAKKTFKEMKGKGYAAFRLSHSGHRGEQLHEFDATAEQILMVPQLRGG